MLRSIFLAVTAAFLTPMTAIAQDSGVGWGTLDSSGIAAGPAPAEHFDDSQTALVVAQGQSAFLAGSSFNVTAIGVQNSVSVVGDHNILNTDQDGSNSGDVTSHLFLNEDTGTTEVDADSNLFSTEE